MEVTAKEAKEVFHRVENEVVTKNIEATIEAHKEAMFQKSVFLYLLKILSLQDNQQPLK